MVFELTIEAENLSPTTTTITLKYDLQGIVTYFYQGLPEFFVAFRAFYLTAKFCIIANFTIFDKRLFNKSFTYIRKCMCLRTDP